jgi:hypothetical protein
VPARGMFFFASIDVKKNGARTLAVFGKRAEHFVGFR